MILLKYNQALQTYISILRLCILDLAPLRVGIHCNVIILMVQFMLFSLKNMMLGSQTHDITISTGKGR